MVHNPATSKAVSTIKQHHYSAFHTASPRPSLKKSMKKLRFNERVRVHPICKRSSEMTIVEKSQVYYTKDEIVGIQLECKNSCKEVVKKARSLSTANPYVSPAKNLCLILESDTSLRGFEVQLCPARKNNKAMVHKAVHTYYSQMKAFGTSLSPQQREMILADAYSKLSSWSQMLALMTAQKDAAQAYEQDIKISSRSISSVTLIPSVVSPVTVDVKRIMEFHDNDRPQKRCKVSPARAA